MRHIQVSLGVLRFGDDGDPTRLTGYDEKPAIDYTASMGVYCFAPRALAYIEPGERLDFPDLILRLIAAGEIVRAWPSDDYWLDIGRHDDYEQAQEEFESVRDRLIPAELGHRERRRRTTLDDDVDRRLVHRRAERQRTVAVGGLGRPGSPSGGCEPAVLGEGVQRRIPRRLDAVLFELVAEAIAASRGRQQHREGEVRRALDGLLVERELEARDLAPGARGRRERSRGARRCSPRGGRGGSARAPRAARPGGS